MFTTDLSVLLIVTAVLSYFAVVFKQPIIVAYVVSGVLVGPWGLGWIKDVHFIEVVSHLGITLLLFLAGLYLHPQKLLQLFRTTLIATILNCLVSFGLAVGFAYLAGFVLIDSLVIGLALMFSSTILVVKLLPTSRLEDSRVADICIGVLILQDLLAIAVLAFVRCLSVPEGAVSTFIFLTLRLIAFIIALFVVEKFIVRQVMRKIESLEEVLVVVGLAWCFGVATVSNQMGLFHETGAFFAGVVLARHNVSRFLSDQLRPLRDFFLVLFFFTLGANFDLSILGEIFLPAMLLTVLFILIRPWVIQRAFLSLGESKSFSQEVGVRLGQLSEFSLLVALLATEVNQITVKAGQFIQFVTIATFVISSYIVVYKYQTPIGVTAEKLNKD